MSGLGGLNKTPDGVVIGLVQLQLPTIAAKSDLAAQTKKTCAMVQKASKSMPKNKDVDGRNKSGRDRCAVPAKHIML